jgi:hypothetical protein
MDFELAAEPWACPEAVDECPAEGVTEITIGKWIPGSRRVPGN